MKVTALGMAAKSLHDLVPGEHLATPHQLLHSPPGLLIFQAISFHIRHAFVPVDFH